MNNRRRVVVLVVIGALVLGVSGAFWLAGDDHQGGHGRDGHSHSHADIEPREANRPYPTLSVYLVEDAGQRVLKLRTHHFAFVASGETAPDAPNAGHAHLKVNDESIAMFYRDRYVLPRFQPGTYELKVTLNGVDHAPLSVDGSVVSDTVTLEVTRTMPGSPGSQTKGSDTP